GRAALRRPARRPTVRDPAGSRRAPFDRRGLVDRRGPHLRETPRRSRLRLRQARAGRAGRRRRVVATVMGEGLARTLPGKPGRLPTAAAGLAAAHRAGLSLARHQLATAAAARLPARLGHTRRGPPAIIGARPTDPPGAR